MARLLAFSIDGSVVAGGTATRNGILEGTYEGTITENGSGDYTITFTKAFARAPVVTLGTITDVTTCRVKACTAAYVTIEQVGADQTTPEADGDFYVMVMGFDIVDQQGV
jgi:hypothetical protein